MPQVTPQYGPAFPYQVGMLLFNGVVNGQQIYTQPGGIGTKVFPQPPQVNPPPNWKRQGGYPRYPYVYIGLLDVGMRSLDKHDGGVPNRRPIFWRNRGIFDVSSMWLSRLYH